MPLFRKKKVSYDGQWVNIPSSDPGVTKFKSENQSLDNATATDQEPKPKS